MLLYSECSTNDFELFSSFNDFMVDLVCQQTEQSLLVFDQIYQLFPWDGAWLRTMSYVKARAANVLFFDDRPKMKLLLTLTEVPAFLDSQEEFQRGFL